MPLFSYNARRSLILQALTFLVGGADELLRLENGFDIVGLGLVRFPIRRPGALAELLVREGLDQVDSQALEISTPFGDFDSYRAPFLGNWPGVGLSRLSPPRRRERVMLHLRKQLV